MVGFPLLLIPLAIYNIIVFLMPGVSFTDPLVKLTLMSGAEWTVTLSDVLLTLGILLLLAEVIKGARPGAKYLTDHLLSLIVFGAAAAEFVLWPKFGTSTYFLLTALALVDFLSGLALRTRRRAVAVAAPCAVKKEPPKKPRRRRPSRSPRLRLRPRPPRLLRRPFRRQLRSPNPCCWITLNRNRCTPPSRPMRTRRRESPSAEDAVASRGPVTGNPVAGNTAGQRPPPRRTSRTRLSADARCVLTGAVREARLPVQAPDLAGAVGASAHPPAKPAAGCGSAGPGRRSRSIARRSSDRAAAQRSRRPVHGLGHRHELDAGRFVERRRTRHPEFLLIDRYPASHTVTG